MKVLSTVRNIAIIFIGVAAYGEVVTRNQALGYTLALAGFVGYNAAQMGFWKELPLMAPPVMPKQFSHNDDSDCEHGGKEASSELSGLLGVSKNKSDEM